MEDYNVALEHIKQKEALNIIIRKCEKLKEREFTVRTSIFTSPASLTGMIVNLCNRINVVLNSTKCETCDYYSFYDTYRCIKCHKNRELEPCDIELPTEIYYKIFKSAGINLSLVNKSLRSLELPIIKETILQKIPSRYNYGTYIQICEYADSEQGCDIVCYNNYDVRHFGTVLPIFEYYQRDDDGSDYTVIKFIGKDPYDKPSYHSIISNTKLLTKEISEDFLLDISEDDVKNAIEQSHEKMMKSSLAKRFAYVVAYAYSRELDMKEIEKLQGTKHTDFTQISGIMRELEAKLW